MAPFSLITRISRYKLSCPRAVPVTDLACVTRHLTVVHRASRGTVAATKGHWSEAVEGRAADYCSLHKRHQRQC